MDVQAVNKSKQLADINDDDFCVSITKAAELSGLTESQIRYLDTLPTITIGKRRPNERNRVYSKQDVLLLRWIGEQEGRPSDIVDRLKDHQEEILRDLGHVTLQQVLDDERLVLGHDVLVSRLVAVLLSIWRESMQVARVNAIPLCVILGPQDEGWKKAFRESCEGKSFFDLSGALVVWATPGGDVEDVSTPPDSLSIMYARQSWYLPLNQEAIFDTSHFSNTKDAFSVAILWQPGQSGEEKLSKSATYLAKNKSKKKLVELLMGSLRSIIRRSGRSVSVPIVVYLRSGMGEFAARECLRLLLDTCIAPYFADCFVYAGHFTARGDFKPLAVQGRKELGYVSQVKSQRDWPWWIPFVRDRAQPALAQDVHKSVGPMPRGEDGSAVCFPLMALEKVVGVLGIELKGEKKGCLQLLPGYDEADLLRYLICISEIAAEYLSLMESSLQKSERSKVAYISDEVVNWWLDIYHYGGADYARTAQDTYRWLEGKEERLRDDFCIMLVDIYKEGQLTARYQGVEVLVHAVERLKERIKELISHDSIANRMFVEGTLTIFEDPVGDHLLFAQAGMPRAYCMMLLEQIREFWQHEDDDLIWKRIQVKPLALQVSLCHFVGLANYDREVGTHLINYHLKKMAQHLYSRHNEGALQHVLEYEATIQTEKNVE